MKKKALTLNSIKKALDILNELDNPYKHLSKYLVIADCKVWIELAIECDNDEVIVDYLDKILEMYLLLKASYAK